MVWILAIMGVLLLPHLEKIFRSKKAISILTWTNVIDPQKIASFQQKTGIKVYLNYFENNEELLTKLRFAKGAGYDLIIPSDFMVKQLIQEHMIKKLDRARINNLLAIIKPQLIGNYFDPHNDYSVPYLWDLYGIGINSTYFPTTPAASWDLIFDKNITPGHVAMTNDPREVILLAARYLFHTIDNLNASRLEKISNLLLSQKKWVAAYTDLRADYLIAAGTSPVGVLPFSAVMKTIRVNPHLKFLLPAETFILIDSFVIPTTSSKDEYVYQFMEFLFQESMVLHHFTRYGTLPARHDVLRTISIPMLDINTIDWSKLEFFRNVIPASVLHTMWRTLKAA